MFPSPGLHASGPSGRRMKNRTMATGQAPSTLDNDAGIRNVSHLGRNSDEDERMLGKRMEPETAQTVFTDTAKKVFDIKTSFMACVEKYDLSQRRARYGQEDIFRFGNYAFGPKEMNMLGPSNSQLNDECINGLAATFQSLYSQSPETSAFSARCAVFSTFDFPLVKGRPDDERLWSYTKRKVFWKKKVWIIPIHKLLDHHWILAIVYLEDDCHEIHLFDSFSHPQDPWQVDLETVWSFIAQLFKVSNQNGHHMGFDPTDEAWIVKRVFDMPLQSNLYDCGLWVLAWMCDALRGHDPALSITNEAIMSRWRLVLGDIVQSRSRGQSG